MKKQRINLYVASGVWREFRAGCVRRGKSASEIVEYLMNDQAFTWSIEDTATDTATRGAGANEPEKTSEGNSASERGKDEETR